MRNGVGGYLAQNENLRSLRDCVVQLIMTSRGARVMRPDFGTDLRASVFDPLDVEMIDTLREQILQTISRYEPRVIVKRIALTPDHEQQTLRVEPTKIILVTSKVCRTYQALTEPLSPIS